MTSLLETGIRGVCCDFCGLLTYVPRDQVRADDFSDLFVTEFDALAERVVTEHERTCVN